MSVPPTLTIRPDARAASGHPTVHRDEVLSVEGGPIRSGAECDVVTAAGRFLGRGLYAERSRAACRIYVRARRPIDRELLARRVRDAIALREAAGLPSAETDGYRLVFAEGDDLPGIIVDRYADALAIQTLTAGAEARKQDLVAVLEEALEPSAICERNDAATRTAEGLPRVRGWVDGAAERGPTIIHEAGLRFEVDLLGAMKTGHFFDQRENRLLLRRFARGRRVLDLFAYTGGFALNAAAGGAERVLAIDRSEAACEAGRRSAALNGLAERIEHRAADVFAVLDGQRPMEDLDAIVLDPPAFAKKGKGRDTALRAYHRVNTQALRMLPAGGLLLTCSCTHQVTPDRFIGMLRDAGRAARASLRVLATGGQGPDHPISLDAPETGYLKAVLIQVAARY